MSKQTIILFGPPGAGKGTQSELLAEKFGLHLFETSKILERSFRMAETLPEDSPKRLIKVEGEIYDILNEREIWKKGILCSPPFVTKLVIDEIKKLFENDESLILAGSPRTLYEVERVMPVLEKLYKKENIKILLLEISPEQTIFRNSHRKICELMRHSILFNEETDKLSKCPLDGSNLAKRKDLDDPEVIKTRIKEYKERTLPMVKYFEKEGFKVAKINGEQSPAEVFAEILRVVEEK